MIIGLRGAMHAGKDTVADTLTSLAGPRPTKRLSFAAGVRRVYCKIFDQLIESTYSNADKARLIEPAFSTERQFLDRVVVAFEAVLGPTICRKCFEYPLSNRPFVEAVGIMWRQLNSTQRITCGRALQLIGTDIGRNTIHCELWVLIVQDQIARVNESLVIVTDVRFPNESDTLTKLGGTIVEVNRPSLQHNDGRDRTHESETALSKTPSDWVIENDSTLDVLQRYTVPRFWSAYTFESWGVVDHVLALVLIVCGFPLGVEYGAVRMAVASVTVAITVALAAWSCDADGRNLWRMLLGDCPNVWLIAFYLVPRLVPFVAANPLFGGRRRLQYASVLLALSIVGSPTSHVWLLALVAGVVNVVRMWMKW